ncbi:MAG TPA: hypothetical protein VME69_14495 [Methylocella sp.]|nr:hypothetical protein [Methylocella sp.]
MRKRGVQIAPRLHGAIIRASAKPETSVMRTVLFLCTGNYYRSRFAEELFNFAAPSPCPGWTATSRGSRLINNIGPIARPAAEALRQRGMDFDPLGPQAVAVGG